MSQTLEFRGSFAGLAWQMIASLAPAAAALCLLVFGLPGWRVFVATAVFLPIVFAVAWLITRVDRLSLDDAEHVFRRPWRRPLSFGEVSAVRLVETTGLVQAAARTHRGRTEFLLAALPSRERESFERAIRERTGDVEWRWARYAGWKLSALVVAMLVLFYVAGVYYFLHRNPAAALVCEQAPAEPAPPDASMTQREGQGLLVRIPEDINGEGFTIIRTGGFRSVGGTGRLFLQVAGIASEHDLLRYAACSRVGLIPILLKTMLLHGWEDARILASEHGPHRALAIRGKTRGKGEVRVMVQNREAGTEAIVAFAEPDGFDTETLRRLVSRITVEPAK